MELQSLYINTFTYVQLKTQSFFRDADHWTRKPLFLENHTKQFLLTAKRLEQAKSNKNYHYRNNP